MVSDRRQNKCNWTKAPVREARAKIAQPGCDSSIFKKGLDRGHRDGPVVTALVEDSVYKCL